MKPYIDEKIGYGFIRTFDPNETSNDEYVWHQDLKNRKVKILEGEGWQFQYDGDLPFFINKDMELEILAMDYHRIIPGKTKLKIEIIEEN